MTYDTDYKTAFCALADDTHNVVLGVLHKIIKKQILYLKK